MSPQLESLHKIRQHAGGELSLRARLGYVTLLLVSAAMTVILLSLWLTEPFLPARTHTAFGAMTVISIAWMVFALWALATRRVLYARDRVIAGGMSVIFTSVFLAGAATAVVVAHSPAAYGAMVTAALMLAGALRVWVGARRRYAELSARRLQLETA